VLGPDAADQIANAYGLGRPAANLATVDGIEDILDAVARLS
jgi:hypothetical protein